MSTRKFTNKKRNGASGSTAGRKKAKPVKNINGVTCGNRFLAFISSLAYAKHWTAECDCTSRKLKCKAAKRYGETRATWGSKDSVTLPQRVMKPTA